MDAIAILGIIGGVALLTAFYGGLDVDRVRIPPLPRSVRFASGALGAVLLLYVMWVTYQQAGLVKTEEEAGPAAMAEPTGIEGLGGCGELEVISVNPRALLEEEMRLYKVFGAGFCKDTTVSISGGAFVGSEPGIQPNGQPAEVASDGTWLTVYIYPAEEPGEAGQTIRIRNPDNSEATVFVQFQR
ncbi:MAG: hypothetical protein JNK32_01110 [Anaerolineales bacterium]|nr:hypothetical protein [Anaerolineales bacterium]